LLWNSKIWSPSANATPELQSTICTLLLKGIFAEGLNIEAVCVVKTKSKTYMRVLLISTSPRAASNSLKTSVALAHGFTALNHDAEVVSLENCDVPMVGRGSINPDQLTDFQQVLTEAWANADTVIFAVPEYNWTNGGEFVNLLHQLGGKAFAHLFHQKCFAFVGISAGRGGRLPALDGTVLLNKIISFTGGVSITSPKILEAHEVPKNLDADGNSLGNPIFDQAMADFVAYTAKVGQRWVAGA
jgi:chromate reductase, NAD(P)H dehydrogenase (quinone)